MNSNANNNPIFSEPIFVDSLERYRRTLLFSGAGFKKGPAVGQCLTELICDGAASTVDLTPFRLSRFDTDEWRKPWSDSEYIFTSDFGHKF